MRWRILSTGSKNVISKIGGFYLKKELNWIGKPEPLKHTYSGKWSRRIDNTHRLIYGIEGDTIYIYSAKGHYS